MPPMQPLKRDEVERVRLALGSGPNAARNLALFEVGIGTGFRVSELLSLRVGDVLTDDGIAARVTVARQRMKGRRASRSVVLSDRPRRALAAYLAERRRSATLLRDLPLFVVGVDRPLSRTAAWEMLTTAYRRAGLGRLGYGCHGMRKTFAGGVHDVMLQRVRSGASTADVLVATQHALGHRSVDSTVRYLAFRQVEVDEAVLEVGRL